VELTIDHLHGSYERVLRGYEMRESDTNANTTTGD
jgi:hypothetical protein